MKAGCGDVLRQHTEHPDLYGRRSLELDPAAAPNGGTARSSTPGPITQGEGSYDPGMTCAELAGRVRDCPWRPLG
jgi:hypothetical protein